MMMKVLFYTTTLSALAFKGHACPFSRQESRDGANEAPNDANHKHLRRRLYASLREDDETREAIASIVFKKSRNNDVTETARFLQDTPPSNCVSRTIYDSIRADVTSISDSINNDRDKGHFIGGIVRLAAHDFMDFDITAESDPDSQPLGPDGCLDFSHPHNAGLPDLWCDDPVDCPLKALYDNNYSFMSKADFWVAAANGVIQSSSLTSNARPNGLELPFKWGRVDNDTCEESSPRLPEPHGCSQVEGVFLTRMGLSWRDAVALLGAHTLGRGDIRFSGHDGTWVDSDARSTVFDKRFYEEVIRRAWRPRQVDAGVNWTWGGNNRGVMMLNTDICLFFDIPEGNEQNCCTDTNNNCRDASIQNNQCATAENVRPEAFAAFNEFLGGQNLNNGNQEPFYVAFAEAWTKATQLGHGDNELFELSDSCGPTASPTAATPEPTASPIVSIPEPTASPVVTPPTSPVTQQPVGNCQDVESFTVEKMDGETKTKTCDQISLDNCTKFGHFCRVTCGVCDCLTEKMRCESNDECCSGVCNNKGKCTA